MQNKNLRQNPHYSRLMHKKNDPVPLPPTWSIRIGVEILLYFAIRQVASYSWKSVITIAGCIIHNEEKSFLAHSPEELKCHTRNLSQEAYLPIWSVFTQIVWESLLPPRAVCRIDNWSEGRCWLEPNASYEKLKKKN